MPYGSDNLNNLLIIDTNVGNRTRHLNYGYGTNVLLQLQLHKMTSMPTRPGVALSSTFV